MREIGSGSGVAIIEDGERLYIIDRQTGGLAIGIFVLALIGGLGTLGGIGITAKTISSGGVGLTIGLVLLGVGLFVDGLLALVIRIYRRRKDHGVDQARQIVVIDLRQGLLCDPTGQSIAPLQSVRFRRRFQVTSSSKALEAVFPTGSIEIAAGNPFAGGLGNLEAALAQRGLQVG
jgi:hypothetical protein